MVFLYNISIRAYYFFIIISSLFNEKASLWIKGRKGVFEKLNNDLKNNIDPVIWFHIASLGEFEQGRPVIEAYKEKNPDHKIVLTFFSPSGYEIRKNYDKADFIYYLPLDTKKNARKIISIINPQQVVFVKYEFWYHYLNELIHKKIPVYVISAIFRKNQLFFKWYGIWYKNLLKKIHLIFVQNKTSFNLLKSNGFSNIELSSDTRFDRVYNICQNPKKIDSIKNWIHPDFKTIIGGSTWPTEEEFLSKYNTENPKANIIIAPHEIHESNLKRIEQLFQGNITRFSNIDSKEKKGVLLIDKIGILSSIYQYGDVAFIGGGFGKGIHNTLEAATFGLPVIFGPNFQKFNEAIELIQEKGAFPIKDFEELRARLNLLINDEEFLQKTSKNISLYIKNNVGATANIMKVLTIY